MSKINYINLEQLHGCGLLFINTRDPLHQTFKAISKSPAPLVAIWYQTNYDGTTAHDVVFIDPYLGLMRSSYLTSNLTIEELIKNPAVEQICVKRFKPVYDINGEVDQEQTDRLQTKFRYSVAKVTANFKPAGKKQTIAQIFNYTSNQNYEGITSTMYINKIFMEMDIFDQIPNQSINSYSPNSLLMLKDSNDSFIQFMSHLGLKFNSAEINNNDFDETSKDLQSYLLDEKFFEEPKFLHMIEHSDEVKDQSYKYAIKVYTPYLSDLAKTLIEMMSEDSHFFKLVIDGVNKGQITDIEQSDALINIIKSLNANQYDLFKLIEKHSLDHSTSISNYIELFERYTDLYNDSNKLVKSDTEIDLNLNIGPGLASFDAGDLNHDKIKQELNFITNLTLNIKECVQSNQTPQIDLNKLIDSVNYLQQCLSNDHKQIEYVNNNKSYNATITTQSDSINKKSIKLMLNNSTRIKLPCYNPDLSSFDSKTLQEILEYLDRIISDDNDNDSINNLRTVICKRLAEFTPLS